MRTRVVPDRNSAMIASRSFCGMSPCIADTVKLLLLIFSVSQSTCPMSINKSDHIQVCVTAAAAVTVYETTFMQQATSSFIPICSTFTFTNLNKPIRNPSTIAAHTCHHIICSSRTNLPLCVAEDDSLGDGESVIKITQCVKLPFFTFNRHKKLLDTLFNSGHRKSSVNYFIICYYIFLCLK